MFKFVMRLFIGYVYLMSATIIAAILLAITASSFVLGLILGVAMWKLFLVIAGTVIVTLVLTD
jgi:hypothetical protein